MASRFWNNYDRGDYQWAQMVAAWDPNKAAHFVAWTKGIPLKDARVIADRQQWKARRYVNKFKDHHRTTGPSGHRSWY